MTSARSDRLASSPFCTLPSALVRDPTLSPLAKVLYALIDTYAGSGDSPFPRLSVLAEQMGVSVRRVQQVRAELVAAGWLAVEKRQRSDGGQASNEYRLLPASSLGTKQVASPPPVQPVSPPPVKRVSPHELEVGLELEVGQDLTLAMPEETASRQPPEPSTSKARPRTPRTVKVKEPRPRDELFDALIEGLGWVEPLPKSQGGWAGKAAAELRDIGATPADILERCAYHRQLWPTMTLTPTSLTKHWAALKYVYVDDFVPDVMPGYEGVKW